MNKLGILYMNSTRGSSHRGQAATVILEEQRAGRAFLPPAPFRD